MGDDDYSQTSFIFCSSSCLSLAIGTSYPWPLNQPRILASLQVRYSDDLDPAAE